MSHFPIGYSMRGAGQRHWVKINNVYIVMSGYVKFHYEDPVGVASNIRDVAIIIAQHIYDTSKNYDLSLKTLVEDTQKDLERQIREDEENDKIKKDTYFYYYDMEHFYAIKLLELYRTIDS